MAKTCIDPDCRHRDKYPPNRDIQTSECSYRALLRRINMDPVTHSPGTTQTLRSAGLTTS